MPVRTVRGNQRTQIKSPQRKTPGPTWSLTPRPSCCEATMLTTNSSCCQIQHNRKFVRLFSGMCKKTSYYVIVMKTYESNYIFSQTKQICFSIMQQSSVFHLILKKKALMSQHYPFC